MELRQLKYFIAVADQNSFTRASAVLFVSQSAVSQQISALEDELGFPLFIRNKHSVVLTQAGDDFYRRIRSLLDKMDDAVDMARVTAEKRIYAASVTIGIQMHQIQEHSCSHILDCLQSMQDAFPHVIVRTRHIEPASVETLLLDEQVELAIAFDDGGSMHPVSKKVSCMDLGCEWSELCISKRVIERDFGASTPTMHELLERYPINLVRYGASSFSNLLNLYRRYDAKPKHNYFDSSVESQMAAYLGYGMCLEPYAHPAFMSGYLARFLVDKDLSLIHRTLLWRSDIPLTAPAQYFLDQIKAIEPES